MRVSTHSNTRFDVLLGKVIDVDNRLSWIEERLSR